jgi:hypothetical protein
MSIHPTPLNSKSIMVHLRRNFAFEVLNDFVRGARTPIASGVSSATWQRLSIEHVNQQVAHVPVDQHRPPGSRTRIERQPLQGVHDFEAGERAVVAGSGRAAALASRPSCPSVS